MGKLERLREIRFWIDYYMQDMWMRKKLKKMNDPNVDFTQEEAHQQKRMLKYAKKAYPEFLKHYHMTGD